MACCTSLIPHLGLIIWFLYEASFLFLIIFTFTVSKKKRKRQSHHRGNQAKVAHLSRFVNMVEGLFDQNTSDGKSHQEKQLVGCIIAGVQWKS